jgi:hypothetical protein
MTWTESSLSELESRLVIPNKKIAKQNHHVDFTNAAKANLINTLNPD